MVSKENLPLGAAGWQAEHLRTTAFILRSQLTGTPTHWWQQAVGGAPEEERSRPQEGTIQQVGQFAGQQLVVVWRPDRVDWRFLPSVGRLDQPLGGFPVLGPFGDVMGPFVEFSEVGLKSCPPVTRLALGAVLVKPVSDLDAGYTELSQYLPGVKLDFQQATDFLYQINRFRPSSSVSGVVVNRLTKWAMSVSGSIGISLTPGSGVVVPSGPPQYACRLELDINSAPSADSIDTVKVGDLFREFVDLGYEIAEKGDIP